MTTATCGLPECSSSCHDAGVATGRYCAPARCYCGGCPAHVPVDRSSQAMTLEQMEQRRHDRVEQLREQLRHDREARDLRDALHGEPIAKPSIERRLWTAGVGGLVAA